MRALATGARGQLSRALLPCGRHSAAAWFRPGGLAGGSGQPWRILPGAGRHAGLQAARPEQGARDVGPVKHRVGQAFGWNADKTRKNQGSDK